MRLDTQNKSRTLEEAAPVTQLVPDLEVYRTANTIVTLYGDEALRFATQQAERFRQRGEPNGQAVWTRIGDAAGELLFAKAEIQRSME